MFLTGVQSLHAAAKDAKVNGNNYYKQKDFTKAIECYTEAISLHPGGADNEVAVYYCNRAACHLFVVGRGMLCLMWYHMTMAAVGALTATLSRWGLLAWANMCEEKPQ